MKKLSKLIILPVFFQLLLVIAFASSDYPYEVQGPTAEIRNEGVIHTGEGDPLNITFTSCNNITINSYRYIQNDGGPVYNKPPFGYFIQGNILMFNSNHISFTSWLETITYIPYINCDKERTKYAPHIKVYEQKDVKRSITPTPTTNDSNTTIIKINHTNNGNETIKNQKNKINLSQKPDENGKTNIQSGIITLLITIIVIGIVIVIAKRRGKPIGESLRELIKNNIGIEIPKKSKKSIK